MKLVASDFFPAVFLSLPKEVTGFQTVVTDEDARAIKVEVVLGLVADWK